MLFNRQFILSVIPQAIITGNDSLLHDVAWSIDTRTLCPQDLFVALQGAVADGHSFVVEACKKGASGCIIKTGMEKCLADIPVSDLKDFCVISVPDVLEAVLAFARAFRAQFKGHCIGVTGSVGKTTTKEMLVDVFGASGKSVVASIGNQNTLLGIALNTMRLRDHHEFAIFEMGVSKRGEMARMAELVRPETALITAIGHSHLEGLGSVNDVASEKRDIFKFFTDGNVGIINGDSPYLTSVSYRHPVIRFGSKMINQVQARKVSVASHSITFQMKIYEQRFTMSLHGNNLGRLSNALSVAATAYYYGIQPEIIVAALSENMPVKGRFEPINFKNGSGFVISDCYNANPESMKAALEAFEKIEASSGKKVAILGDMLELGANSPYWHRQIGRIIRKMPSLSRVILIGSHVGWTKKTLPSWIQSEIYPTWTDALACLKTVIEPDSVVLIKGSRGMKLHNLVTSMTE